MNTNQSKSEKPLDIAIYFRSKARSAAVAFFAWDLLRRYWNDVDYFVEAYDESVKFITADYEIYSTQNANIFNPGPAIGWYDLIVEFKRMIADLFPVIVFLKRSGWVPAEINNRSIRGDNHMLYVVENVINKD